MLCGQQVKEQETIDSGTYSAWMRRHLSGSIYIWACGQKADDQDDDSKLSDAFIGWLVLFMQAFAYTMLIFLARATSNSDTGGSSANSDESGYLLPSVTGATYLLVASTTHDLHAGYFLLMDGKYAGHRAFGLGLLILYGIMVGAAMTVLVSTSSDSASVVLNAVTVLFVADLDEKALKFLVTVPQNWRLFWAMESIGISFALALVAIFYIGDTSPLLEDNNEFLQPFPTWFVWGVNPAAVTLSSFLVSNILQAVCDRVSEASQIVDESTFRVMVDAALEGLCITFKESKQLFVGDPWFYLALGVWFALGVAQLFLFEGKYGFLVAFVLAPPTQADKPGRWVFTGNKAVLLCVNALLAAGLGRKTLGVARARYEGVVDTVGTRYLSGGSGATDGGGNHDDSCAPSLLVGWGIGYWSASILHVLCCAWNGGECGWNDAPKIVTGIAYIVIPVFSVSVIFMVADINFLGKRVGAFVKPAVDRMTNRRRVEYWVMASLLRDIFALWILFCVSLTWNLVYKL